MQDISSVPVGGGAPAPVPFGTIGVVGLGLIGGSIALAVRRAWPSVHVVAVDSEAVIAEALQARAIDAGGPTLTTLHQADLVVLAAPVRQNLDLIGRLPGVVKSTAIVTDVGSTKRDIVTASTAVGGGLTFVAGHPVAGAAVGGFANARADLFRNRPWIFTPVETTSDAAVRRVQAFAAGFGALTSVMTLADHDRVFAFISHVPQLAVSALMAVAGNAVGAEGLALAGRGLLDTTRLASSPSDIWRDVAAVNADEIAPALDALIAVLQALRGDLRSGERLAEVFVDAARWRDELVARSTL